MLKQKFSNNANITKKTFIRYHIPLNMSYFKYIFFSIIRVLVMYWKDYEIFLGYLRNVSHITTNLRSNKNIINEIILWCELMWFSINNLDKWWLKTFEILYCIISIMAFQKPMSEYAHRILKYKIPIRAQNLNIG